MRVAARTTGLLAAGCLILGAFFTPARAVNPDEVLADPALEARARALSQELRCLVCQNQSIDDSNAALARDLRIIVRERLVAGDSDAAVIDYLVARYGNYVLLKPPFAADTAMLWIGPVLMLLAAGAVFVAYIRRRPGPDDETALPLTDDERRQVTALTEDR